MGDKLYARARKKGKGLKGQEPPDVVQSLKTLQAIRAPTRCAAFGMCTSARRAPDAPPQDMPLDRYQWVL